MRRKRHVPEPADEAAAECLEEAQAKAADNAAEVLRPARHRAANPLRPSMVPGRRS